MHDPTKVTSKQMLLLYVYVCMYIQYIYIYKLAADDDDGL